MSALDAMEWHRGDTTMRAFGKGIACSCHVRNELNGERAPNEVVYTMPNHRPYYPRQFPVGAWEVYRAVPRIDPYEAPFFIPTNAYLEVPTWELDEAHRYVAKTGKTDIDAAYGLHHSTSSTTLGCLKIESEPDLRWLVDQINQAYDGGDTVMFTVS